MTDRIVSLSLFFHYSSLHGIGIGGRRDAWNLLFINIHSTHHRRCGYRRWVFGVQVGIRQGGSAWSILKHDQCITELFFFTTGWVTGRQVASLTTISAQQYLYHLFLFLFRQSIFGAVRGDGGFIPFVFFISNGKNWREARAKATYLPRLDTDGTLRQ